MSLKNIYKSRLGASVYLRSDGKAMHFIDGKYITDDEKDILELEALVKSGVSPHIYVDAAESQIDTSLQDAIAEAQRKATLEVLEQFKSKKDEADASQVSTQVGTVPAQTITSATMLNVATSATLGDLQAPSGS